MIGVVLSTGHEGAVWDVTLMTDRAFTFTASQDKTVKMWKAGKCERVFHGKWMTKVRINRLTYLTYKFLVNFSSLRRVACLIQLVKSEHWGISWTTTNQSLSCWLLAEKSMPPEPLVKWDVERCIPLSPLSALGSKVKEEEFWVVSINQSINLCLH